MYSNAFLNRVMQVQQKIVKQAANPDGVNFIFFHAFEGETKRAQYFLKSILDESSRRVDEITRVKDPLTGEQLKGLELQCRIFLAKVPSTETAEYDFQSMYDLRGKNNNIMFYLKSSTTVNQIAPDTRDIQLLQGIINTGIVGTLFTPIKTERLLHAMNAVTEKIFGTAQIFELTKEALRSERKDMGVSAEVLERLQRKVVHSLVEGEYDKGAQKVIDDLIEKRKGGTKFWAQALRDRTIKDYMSR